VCLPVRAITIRKNLVFELAGGENGCGTQIALSILSQGDSFNAPKQTVVGGEQAGVNLVININSREEVKNYEMVNQLFISIGYGFSCLCG